MAVILVVASQGFQSFEFTAIKTELERAGQVVLVASDKSPATANDGSKVIPNLLLSAISPKDNTGLFLIGGPGALAHLDTEEFMIKIKEWANSGKLFGAICISPRLLAKAGVLANKKITGWNLDDELPKILTKYQAQYVPQPVVRDGQVITADGPGSAMAFGREIARALKTTL
ncbi:MAG TPA: DJ-1/PfpI family protein [Patescibacteria group bacterium]|nr:DJ-1/PfpI family protein [Patescibacteria group bacterium]